MHIYGKTGYLFSDNPNTVRYRLSEQGQEETEKLPDRAAPYNNPFTFFAAAVNGEIIIPENDLASLKINMIVVEILEAAKKSNMTGKRVKI